MESVQAVYPKKMCTATVPFDTLNVVYPVNKSHATGKSSSSLGNNWRNSAGVLKHAVS